MLFSIRVVDIDLGEFLPDPVIVSSDYDKVAKVFLEAVAQPNYFYQNNICWDLYYKCITFGCYACAGEFSMGHCLFAFPTAITYEIPDQPEYGTMTHYCDELDDPGMPLEDLIQQGFFNIGGFKNQKIVDGKYLHGSENMSCGIFTPLDVMNFMNISAIQEILL